MYKVHHKKNYIFVKVGTPYVQENDLLAVI